MNGTNDSEARVQRSGGYGALYLACAYIAAMPYFLMVVDYPGATTVARKVDLVIGNYASMYAMYLATYVVFGLVVGVLSLALYDRLRETSPTGARTAAFAGLLWSMALVASGMVYTYGMTTIMRLAETDLAGAHDAWMAIEPVALALGGAGGELLGGLWVLLVSALALKGRVLPKALCWLGLVIGMAGLASVVPPMHDAAYAFGMLQIVWFAWLGTHLLRARSPMAQRVSAAAVAA